MRAALHALLLLLAACGLSGGEGGGSDHLPTAAGGPYGFAEDDPATPAAEPFVIVERTASLGDPSALPRAGGFDVWMTRRAGDLAPREIAFTHVDDLATPPLDPVVVLTALEAWEGGSVEAPAVVDDGAGGLVMFYQGGGDAAPAVGRARSLDGGATWLRDGLVLDGAMDPTALVVDGTTYLYYGYPDGRGIGLATSADGGLSFTPSPDAALLPRPGVIVDEEAAFDAAWVGEPAVIGGLSATGRLRIGLFYVGRSPSDVHAVGHAVSLDGARFERFAGGLAVLDPLGSDERAPSAVVFADHAVLFVGAERSGRGAIAVASHP